ncbi:MAG: pyruvate dehydrogenase complex dihydrolipoamide acetyltransferase [Alphaproteobacteria bacterium]|nr:pyruvate dehydrogenase complex dihydrolipoamide acetyltransferase [Alphaproteobacteria bacterium]
MPTTITMPALSPTMTEGTLARWLIKEGDNVSAGDIIAEIETDKATMEVEAVDEGAVGQLLIPEGTEGVPVNQPIAVLLEEGEDASSLDGFLPPQAASPALAPAGEASPVVQSAPAAPPETASTPVPALAPIPNDAGSGGERIFASPLARRMAEKAGLDLTSIRGTGPRGRIVKADIEAALSGAPVEASVPPAQAAPAPAPVIAAPSPVVATGESQVVPHSNMRKVIARRLLESKQTVPHFYLTVDCEIDRLLAMRKELNERDGADYKISVNDFVIRAVALALQKNSEANASWSEEGMVRHGSIDVSVAVAIEAGLITPIIRNADHKGLAMISAEMKDLAGRARDGKLMPEEYQRGTFSISNLGMYGIREFSAIINPPQSAILAVGAGEQRPVVKDGALSVATVMSCTLSCDHRVVDGALGAQLLGTFKNLIEDPMTMLL